MTINSYAKKGPKATVNFDDKNKLLYSREPSPHYNDRFDHDEGNRMNQRSGRRSRLKDGRK